MASKKVTLFFQDADGFGWSETYYCSQSSDSLLLAAVNGLVISRMGLSTTNVICTHGRIATATKKLVTIIPLNNGAGIPGQQPIPTDAPEVALKVQLISTGFGFNRKMLRGIPDRVVQDNTFVPDDDYIIVMNAFRTYLLSQGFNAVGRLGTGTGATPIDTITPTPPRGFSFISNLTAIVGDTVRVTQVMVPGYNGIKIVVDKTASGSRFLYTVGGAAPAVAPSPATGKAEKQGQYDQPLTSVVYDGVTRRAAGRPFGHSRGRRATTWPLRR